jgi:hypothetical protein
MGGKGSGWFGDHTPRRYRMWPRFLGGAADGKPVMAAPDAERHLVVAVMPELDYGVEYDQRIDVGQEHYVKEKFAFTNSDLVLEAWVRSGGVRDVGPRLWEQLVDAGIRVASHTDDELRAMARDLYDQMIAPAMEPMFTLVGEAERNAHMASGYAAAVFQSPAMTRRQRVVRDLVVEAMVTMARGVAS